MPKKVVNESNDLICDSITLSAFTRLQSYGALLVIDKKSLKIIQYSENACDILQTPVSGFHNNEVSLFLAMSHRKYDVNEWLQNSNNHYGHFTWKYDQILLEIWAYIHQQNDVIILEIEIDDKKNHDNYVFFLIDEGVNLDIDFSLSNSAMSICEKIQRITQYDRVILYKFEDDSSGVAIGEARTMGMESYLGLHFPATDIPYHVREIYLRQPIRYIPNTNDVSVALVSDPLSNANFSVDFSNVLLRAVSSIHIEYMHNMGASASVSIAIICKNKLWGLIVLHNKEPKEIPIYCRFALLILARLIAKQLVELDDKKNNMIKESTNKLEKSFQRMTNGKTDFLAAFEAINDIVSRMLCADGIAYVFQNQISMSGVTPTMQEIENISDWLFYKHPSEIYATHELSSEYTPGLEFKEVSSGLLAIPFSPNEKKYLLFFRKEVISDITWAGDPTHVLVKTENRYSPRPSFNQYKKSTFNQSKKWTSSELSTAEIIQQMIKTWQLQLISNEKKKIAIQREEEIKEMKMMEELQTYLEKRLSVSKKELANKDKKFTSAIKNYINYKISLFKQKKWQL